jgi:hypothetical protein
MSSSGPHEGFDAEEKLQDSADIDEALLLWYVVVHMCAAETASPAVHIIDLPRGRSTSSPFVAARLVSVLVVYLR